MACYDLVKPQIQQIEKGAVLLSTSVASENSSQFRAILTAALLCLAVGSSGAVAQGLDADGAIDAIVGSEVSTGEEAVAADEERIIAAIDNTTTNTAEVRKRFNLDQVEIVFLPDFAEEETAVDAKMEEHSEEIAALRSEIQGSAIFYHAVDSRSVLLNDIIALEFDDNNGVTIFVAGREPGTGD